MRNLPDLSSSECVETDEDAKGDVMLKRLRRFVLLAVLAAGLLVSVAPLWTAPAKAAFCAPICDPLGACRFGLVAVHWIGSGCTGNEPRCYGICISEF